MIDRSDWDAIVVGAGPAGSLAARRLAIEGRSVLLIDKARRGRAKVCGGCLGSVGLAALDEAGTSLGALGVASTPLRRVSIHSRGRSVWLPLARRAAISRADLDARLIEAAEHVGVTVATECRATIESCHGDWREVRVRGAGADQLIRAKLVLIAAGLGSHRLIPPSERSNTVARQASRLGAGAILPAGDWPSNDDAVTMICGTRGEGYVGLARLPGGSLDVAAALSPAALPTGEHRMATLAADILEQNGLPLPPAWFDAPWRSTPTLTQRPAVLGAERVLLLGDAAGYVEPFTGEGIGWALRSALAVQPLAGAAIDRWEAAIPERWQRLHAVAIGRQQRRCRMVCDLIGARRVTSLLVRTLTVAPWTARPVLRLIDPPHLAST